MPLYITVGFSALAAPLVLLGDSVMHLFGMRAQWFAVAVIPGSGAWLVVECLKLLRGPPE